MAALNEKIISDVLALSRESRTQLVEIILESLNIGSNKVIDAMWIEEINRRVEEVEAGTVQLIPEEQVFDELITRLKK